MNTGIESYQAINRHPLSLKANWENFRFACIDSESTGFDPRKDRLVSLAGIGVRNGEIELWDAFSVILPVAFNTSSVTVHGITREEAAEGLEEPVALDRFAAWLGDGVIVGHHIRHDLVLLNTALQRHFQIELRNVVIDTMEAYLAVVAGGGFAALEEARSFSLDALCERFQIVPHDRHTAHGDAFLTAQLLLRILKEAGKTGQWNLSDLRAWHANQPFPE
jgi:DNA polymerase III subunit epsilon